MKEIGYSVYQVNTDKYVVKIEDANYVSRYFVIYAQKEPETGENYFVLDNLGTTIVDVIGDGYAVATIVALFPQHLISGAVPSLGSGLCFARGGFLTFKEFYESTKRDDFLIDSSKGTISFDVIAIFDGQYKGNKNVRMDIQIDPIKESGAKVEVSYTIL
ncbi:MAG: hypothetical protein FWF58_05800 [Firmicutes bacterium]|nr:hypothetical protein [Bacillota bacterium]